MIVLGRLVSPFGIQGWLRVHPFGDDPLAWKEMPTWWLGPDPDGDDWKPFTLKACKLHGDGLVASFGEIADRTAAEQFAGWYVAAPREALPAPDEDEWYWGDLVGLSVENAAGVALGTVSGLLSTGAHDVLQVKDGKTERLIPFVASYVTSVDQEARKIVVEWEADW